jgi:hypothetical protein
VCTILKRPEGNYNDAEDAQSSPAIWNCSVPPMYRVKLQSRGRDSFEGGVCKTPDGMLIVCKNVNFKKNV